MAHVVTAAFVKVSIGSPDGNRVARILARGAIVPEGVPVEALTSLVARGFITEVDEIVADSLEGEPVVIVGAPTEPGTPEGTSPGAVVVPVGTEGVEVPEGAPEKSWTHAQIDAWAARQPTPILLEADASKDVKLAAIAGIKS
jgi:hypothetical protein